MLTDALESRSAASHDDAAYLTRDWQRFPQLLAACAVAGITAFVVTQSRHEVTALALLTAIGTVAAGVVVAAALLRLIDVVALHRQIREKSLRTETTLDNARRRLEESRPNIGARAARIDAKALLEHTLHKRDGATASE